MWTAAGGRGLARSLPGHPQGRRGKRVGNAIQYKYVIGRAVNIRQLHTKTLCLVREAKANGDEYFDQDSEGEIVNREVVRQDCG